MKVLHCHGSLEITGCKKIAYCTSHFSLVYVAFKREHRKTTTQARCQSETHLKQVDHNLTI